MTVKELFSSIGIKKTNCHLNNTENFVILWLPFGYNFKHFNSFSKSKWSLENNFKSFAFRIQRASGGLVPSLNFMFYGKKKIRRFGTILNIVFRGKK